MPDITNPEVLAFLRDSIRPFAEALRNIDAMNEERVADYSAKIQALIASNLDADLIEDGRAAEGVSRMTKKDLVDFMSLLSSIKSAFDATGRRDIMRKPTVRPFII